jgi:hypothetical protein
MVRLLLIVSAHTVAQQAGVAKHRPVDSGAAFT